MLVLTLMMLLDTGMDLPFIWDSEEFDWEEDYCPFYTQGDVQLFSGCADAQLSADMKGTSLITIDFIKT